MQLRIPKYNLKRLMIAYFVLLLSGVLAACAGEPPEPPPTSTTAPTATKSEKTARFLALGDSYTIGQNVAEAERWPVQMVAALRNQGIAIEDAEIIARTGWTTRSLITAINKAQPQGPYDVVSLLIGVNNQYQGQSADVYREEFRALLQTAIALAGRDPQRVVVLSIPDYSITPFARGSRNTDIAGEIDLFNRINQEESSAAGVRYVDITPYSREAAEDLTLIAHDGLHPSGKMYAGWVELAFGEFVEVSAK